ncbi:MAG TPA: mismatch-specific DNA-glycosylase [Chloroflexota bacterium]|jgi:TDG/mug DNA glycosylase family protein
MDLPADTLPDLLGPGLKVVFVGINPSSYSAARGHYFAGKQSRFWPAFSRSRLSAPIRRALGREQLGPEDDRELPRFGFGFTDLVKVPSNNAAALRPDDFAGWAPDLPRRLAASAPAVVCFHGTMAFRPFRRFGLGLLDRAPTAPQRTAPHRPAQRAPGTGHPAPGTRLGAQPETLNGARIFVVPNPSPANAHVTPAEQVTWYDRLADFVEEIG